MAGRIPKSFIDDLVERADIVDVVGSRLKLRKQGREYVALCPFHNEKSPSFTVSPEKQFYHCFGCGAHGTAISFLMDFDHLDFVEAVETLAEQMGLEVPREGGAPDRPQPGTDLYGVMEAADRLYRQALRQSPEAVDYLKGRGLTGETAGAFGLGYAPDAWDTLLKRLGSSPKGREQLFEAGLIKENERGRVFDRFRGRIMFPIRDRRGRTIAFGGRLIDPEAKGPKYLNSPETTLFHKSEALYGFWEARQALGRLDRVLVVEGYMDVIALAQQGIRYAVATLGTATTREHLEQLFRQTSEVIFCFDGDRAGQEAAWRAMNNALPAMREGREARFLFLPQGEDPDSLVQQEGREAFETRMESQSVAFSEFFFRELTHRHDLSSRERRASFAREVVPLLRRMPAGILREMMTERLSQLVDMPAERLEQWLAGKAEGPTTAPQPVTRGRELRMTPMRTAIAALLQHPSLVEVVGDLSTMHQAELGGAELLAELAAFIEHHAKPSMASILEHWRGEPHEETLSRLAVADLPGLDDEAAGRQILRDALERLNQAAADKRTADLLAKDASRQALTDAEKRELLELLHRRND